MTEVDVSIPESSTLSTANSVVVTTTTSSSNITETNNNNTNNMTRPESGIVNSQSQCQNGPVLTHLNSDEKMEVDETEDVMDADRDRDKDGMMDTEDDEDDSRITSSTDGKGRDVTDAGSGGMADDGDGDIVSTNTDDNSKSHLITTKSIGNLNENSSNACDGSEKLNAHIFDNKTTTDRAKIDEVNSERSSSTSNSSSSSSSVSSEKVENLNSETIVNRNPNPRPNVHANNSNSNSSSHAVKKIQAQTNAENNDNNNNDDDDDVNDTDGAAGSRVSPKGNSREPSPSKNNIMPADDSSNDSKQATPVADPLDVNRKENGPTTISLNNNLLPGNKSLSFNDSIVDLGDDSDVEISETPEKKLSKNFADSDGAVVIGSDSDDCDNDNIQNQKRTVAATMVTPNASATSQSTPSSQIIDDDDDDCVVIEDDGLSPTMDDLSKRKIGAMDSGHCIDDTQPPTKRLRTNMQNANMTLQQQQQFSIKDARSLMSNVVDASPKRNNDIGIYPVNISPASSSFTGTGPPKLVPVGGGMLPSSMGPMGLTPLTGLPNMTTNATLLPGLTDDMFVLEAPSFIVPYIYEKPPADNIKEVVKDLEDKFSFSKEDLAEVDKTDEFDMTTEQNKEDREEKNAKKNRKRRRNDDADDSWSEESEDDDDDDDDDSESGMRTKILIKEASDDIAVLKGAIKPASALAQSGTQSPSMAKPGQENYFESPLGKFFMDIGVGLVQEFVQSDLIRLQKRKMRKSLGRNVTEFERAIAALTSNLEASKKKNVPFKFNMKRCEFCNFKSESALAMANHYETPHTNGALYKCNFCIFEVPQRSTTEIVYHMEAIHNIKARLIKPLPYHQCPNCGFEDNGKAKLARHQPVCAKKFRPELNLAPPGDWEAPAKIPRIKPRHGLVGTATAYQAMAAQQKAALASIQQQQQARNMQAAALAAQTAVNKMRGRTPQLPAKPTGPVAAAAAAALIRSPNQMRNPAATNVVLPNNYQVGPSGLLLPQTINKKLLNQPSISITPLPRQNATQMPTGNMPSTSKMPQNNMKPGQTVTGKDAKFVICEICDGYIKDLESLRNHMQWIHKVKIHPKMIYNRPPLNCQKCQFRFFTDQGLERHLLGSHGLVTSSMQEAANKGKDAGRCPVCGRVYQWKLLNHVSRDHHMTLKPAHLSYKCTVCTATFGMYKQFETHVYTAHSTVAKKAMDGKKNSSASLNAQSGSSGSNIQRSGINASNDALLKPLKINDEITIIPQPASKSRLTNIDTHVID